MCKADVKRLLAQGLANFGVPQLSGFAKFFTREISDLIFQPPLKQSQSLFPIRFFADIGKNLDCRDSFLKGSTLHFSQI
jgi:hypothetical protein